MITPVAVPLTTMRTMTPAPSGGFTTFVRLALDKLYEFFIGQWLWMLFRHGPLAMGFWKGLSDQDICARIARNSEAQDWVHPVTGAVTGPCEHMIEREYESFKVVVHSVMYIIAIILVLSGVKQYCSTKLKMRAKTQVYSKAIHLSQLQLQLHKARMEDPAHISEGRIPRVDHTNHTDHTDHTNTDHHFPDHVSRLVPHDLSSDSEDMAATRDVLDDFDRHCHELL